MVLTQYFVPEMGAAPTRLKAMCEGLVAEGHEVEVITALPNYPLGRIFEGYRGRLYQSDDSQGYKVHRFWTFAGQGRGLYRLLAYGIFMAITCVGIFRAKKPDWIFVNSGPMFLSLPAWIASKIWKRPVIFNVADLWPDSIFKISNIQGQWIKKFLYGWEAWSYKSAKKVTAVTEGVYQVIRDEKKVPDEKICYLPNGVDLNIFRPEISGDEWRKKLDAKDKTIFCYPGTHGYLHALEKVLDAAQLLKDRDDFLFLFVGGGSEKEKLVFKSIQENISNVRFLDPVPQEELVKIIAAADWGLIHQRNTPLANETRPAKTFPLMAMKKPLLFAGFGEGAELIKEAGAGLVIPPEKPEELAALVTKILDGGVETTEFGESGRKFIETHLDWRVLVKNWLDQVAKDG